MPKAVKFEKFGGRDVLEVRDVQAPTATKGRVVVRVKAAGINPGEAVVRQGLYRGFPTTFPSGEGTDFSGVVDSVGEGVTSVKKGDEVIGYSHERSSHAELVAVPAEQLTPRPANVSWEQGGALFVAGTTAYSCVRAVGLKAGETVVVSGAAGGVGGIAVQLAKNLGANVIGLASEANQQWLRDHGVIPVVYGEGVLGRIHAAAGGAKIDAFIDTFGKGYVELALELKVAPSRINTVIDFEAVEKHKVKADGSQVSANPQVLAELVRDLAEGRLEIPIAKTYPLAQVREAFKDLEERHTRGKIVLIP
jgi:NADPH:quinone reductase-like Zn-dependent oxidoreductase